MPRKWLAVLPLLVVLNKVSLQPIEQGVNARHERRSDQRECCPCPDSVRSSAGFKDSDGSADSSTSPSTDCLCHPRAGDAEASASILLPALRAIQPFVSKSHEKTEPKPLLQPEVGLASSVLETLREATDEEYQDALARDAAKNAVKLIESDLSLLDEPLDETPKNIIRIFLNPKNDDMDDNLPEPSHIQETRCIHPSSDSIQTIGKLKMARPTPMFKMLDSSRKPTMKLKSLLHKNQYDMDSGIGASNIQERILQPNSVGSLQEERLKLSNIESEHFLQDNMKNDGDFDKMVNDGTPTVIKDKPGTNLKLRNLIKSLEIANKEKQKFSGLDLQKYFVTTTKLPPLEFKPFENAIFRTNGPLQFKNLLKLKDVELLPRHDFMKNTFQRKEKEPEYQNLDNKTSQKINCDDNDDNAELNMNRGINKKGMSNNVETIDTVTSATNLKTIIDLENIESSVYHNVNKNSNQINFMSSPLNTNTVSTSSNPVGFKDQESLNYDDTENNEELNSKELFAVNMSQVEDYTQKCLSQTIANEENEKEDSLPNVLNTEEVKKIDSSEYNDQNLYQIELLEDLDLPSVFDNSHVVQETNDPITETSNNDIMIIKKNDIVSDPDSHEKFIQNPECVADMSNENLMQHMERVGNENIMSQIGQPEDTNFVQESQNLNANSHGQSEFFSHSDPNICNNDSGQISFQNLQNMSNTLLKLSESANTSGNLDGDLNETMTNDFQREKHSEELLTKHELNEIPSRESNEISCKTATDVDVLNNLGKSKIDNLNKSSDSENIEMTAEGNAPYNSIANINLELDHQPKTSLLRNTMDDLYSKIITEPTKNLTNIFSMTKQSNLFDNLKSKFDDLFTTTERKSTRVRISSEEDSVNESSNNKPIIASFDNVRTGNKLQKSPYKLLESLAPNIPELNLKSRNKIAAPKSLEQPIPLKPTMNSHLSLREPSTVRTTIQKGSISEDMQHKNHQRVRNPLQNIHDFDSTLTNRVPNFSPLQLPRPFENAFDPSCSTLGAFSDNLKSHVENTLQNVKETFETKIKESQHPGFLRQSDSTKSPNVLDVISRHDDINERLQAVHTDINDRFKLFQQSILDQLNLPSVRNYDFQDDNSNLGIKSSYHPLRKESPIPETFKLRTNKLNSNNMPNLRIVSDDSPSNRIFVTPKINKLSDLPQSKHPNQLKPDLKQTKLDKQGILLEKKKAPILKQNLLPSYRNVGTKSTSNDFNLIRNRETLPNVRKSKILSVKNVPGTKDTLKKSGNIDEFSKDPGTSASHVLPSKINVLDKPMEKQTSPLESNMNQLRKTLLQRHHNTIPENSLKLPLRHPNGNLMKKEKDSTITQKGILNRATEGKTRQGLKKTEKNNAKSDNEELSSLNDTTHSAAQRPEAVRSVEPLRENIPYKCKLICYKDV